METIARCWTNLNYGLIEMTQADGTSDVIAFAWDLETNIRASRQFKVAHQRKAHGKVVDLTDPRDVYEMVANQGQRRVRACIEAVIPRDIVEEAIGVCNGTLAGNTEESLEDRALKIVQAFDKLGVTQAMLELKLGHPMKATIEQELADLRKIYTSIRDGVAKREDFFQIGPKEESPDSREMTEGLHEDAEGEKTEPEEKELTQFDKDVAKHKEDYPDCEYEPTSPRGLAQHLAKSHKKDDKEAGEQGSLGDWAAGAEEKDPFEEEFEKRVSELETDLPNVNIETMNEYLGIMAPKKNYKSVDELKKAIMHHDTFDPMWNGYLKWLMPKQNSK